jgi:choline dehydrogenase
LTIETDALVSRVLIEDGRAIGVRYLHTGVQREARIQREVILCGGAVNSPQLLLLSGIGPAEQLREYGIDVIVDSPAVGAGLQDHPVVTPMWRSPDMRNIWEEATPENMALWQRERRGPMASNGGDGAAFARSRAGLPAPDLEFGCIAAPVVNQGLEPPTERRITILVAAIAPKSRGHIALRSANPQDKPLIDPGYLSHEADVDVLMAGLRQVREIMAHEPITRLAQGEDVPGEQVANDQQLRAWICSNAHSMFHVTSTCAMGGAETAVCDTELRVRGVAGLRVVDASVMPMIPHGPPLAGIIAVAERASDIVKGNTPLTPTEPAL